MNVDFGWYALWHSWWLRGAQDTLVLACLIKSANDGHFLECFLKESL